MSVDFSVANTPLTMNVANGSAAKILFDLLGYSRSEFDGLWGDLDPADVQRRLALREVRVLSAVEAPSESRGVILTSEGVSQGCLVIEQGYDQERLMSYITRLELLAEAALAAGEVISFG